MKKLLTIIGARPQFVKAAVLSRLIQINDWKDKFKEVLVHTGQHYDTSMSDIFFEDMGIPLPNYNLKIGSGSHGKMTGQMLIQIEELLLTEKPDVVIVYGDTNSTLAGTLAASKLHIPIAHVEAGLRSFWKYMPEEQNRILTDHISDYLFCPTETAIGNLRKEGIVDGVFNVGDIMLDANIYYLNRLKAEKEKGINRLSKVKGFNIDVEKDDFALATIHRAENTDNPERLKSIIEALNELPVRIILPLHPRTRKMVDSFGFSFGENVSIIDPIGYFEMLELESLCKCIITDSGGVQKEAYFMKKPCITLRDQTEWIETVNSGWNTLVGSDKSKIKETFRNLNTNIPQPNFYGDGNTGTEILKNIFNDVVNN